MNYIKHLTGFFDRVTKDARLNPTHVSLYVSIFQLWNLNRFRNPISISRDELMKISKISAKATYHKCMRELHNFGYLSYNPSFNPYKGSIVYLSGFENGQVQKIDSIPIKKQAGIEQVPSINGTGTEQVCGQLLYKENRINLLNNNENDETKTKSETKIDSELSNFESGFPEKDYPFDKNEIEQKEKNSAKKEKSAEHDNPDEGNPEIIPQLAEVISYFNSREYPVLEAEKFFNHFQSNGWLVGGKTKMKDWQAAARNWMINSIKFNPAGQNPKPGKLNSSEHKDYSEPL